MEINANITNQNFSNMTYNGQKHDDTDDIMNQMKNKMNYEMNKDNDMDVELNNTNPVVQKEEKNKDDAALDDFIEGLKK